MNYLRICIIVLAVDWVKLGMDSSGFEAYIPEIKNFQLGQSSVLLDNMTVPGKKGFLIVLKKK